MQSSSDTVAGGLAQITHAYRKGTNNEIWMERRLHVDASARVLLLSDRAVDLDETFSNYQKFTTHTKVLPGVSEVQPQ